MSDSDPNQIVIEILTPSPPNNEPGEPSEPPPSTGENEPSDTAPNNAPPKVVAPANKTMFSYFAKLPSKTSVLVEENPRKSAPTFNKQHVDDFQLNRMTQFDTELANPNSNQQVNYLSTLKTKHHIPYSVNKPARGALRARLLQFSEDVRPPYWGTWQKRSLQVTGRRPWGMDNEVFDYEVDSEAEWDLGGPGESLKGDDSDDEEEIDDYEIDMKTFVPHGYVSDDEVDVHSDNEANRSMETNGSEMEEEDSSSAKIVLDTKMPKNGQPVKQTPKMDIKSITLGLSFEGNPSISENKLQFLRAFQGVSCSR